MSYSSDSSGGLPAHERKKFKRRIFLVKNRFQMLFAVVPLTFLALFLVAGGAYLYWFLEDTLNYYLYLPHCRIDNIWGEVSPAIVNVAAVGGGSFLVILAVWAARRYHTLRRDIASVEEWASDFGQDQGRELARSLKDREVRIIAERLVEAAERFGKWDAKVEERKVEFLAEAESLKNASDENFIAGLAALNEKWKRLWDEINRVRVDERLS